MDNAERVRLEQMLEPLKEATANFERLVGAKTMTDLLDEVARLNEPELRKTLLARVLVEQQLRR
jgi:hypothetical protein